MPLIWLLLLIFLCVVGICVFRQHPPESSQERGSTAWIQKRTPQTNSPLRSVSPKVPHDHIIYFLPTEQSQEKKNLHQPHDHTESELPDVALTLRRTRRRRPEEAYEDQDFVEEIEDIVELQKTNQQIVEGETQTTEEEVIHGCMTKDSSTQTEEPEDIETQTQATQTEESATQVDMLDESDETSTQTEKEVQTEEEQKKLPRLTVQKIPLINFMPEMTKITKESQVDIPYGGIEQFTQTEISKRELVEKELQTEAPEDVINIAAYQTQGVQTSFLVDEPEEHFSLEQQNQNLSSVSAVSFEKSVTQPIQFQPVFNSQPQSFSSILVGQEEEIHRERPSPLFIDMGKIESLVVETPSFPRLPTASLDLSASRPSEPDISLLYIERQPSRINTLLSELSPITGLNRLSWQTIESDRTMYPRKVSLPLNLGLESEMITTPHKISLFSLHKQSMDEISFDFIQKPSLSSFDLSFDQERIVVPRKLSSLPFDIIEEQSQRTATLRSYSIIDDHQ